MENQGKQFDTFPLSFLGVTAETGPREPWHDCHAKAEGPIAYDIKKNFEERWEKQGSGSEWFNTLNDGEFADPEASPPLPDEEGGPWTLQLFRSITGLDTNTTFLSGSLLLLEINR